MIFPIGEVLHEAAVDLNDSPIVFGLLKQIVV